MSAETISSWCKQVSASSGSLGILQLRASFGVLVFALAALATFCACIIALYLRCESNVRAAVPRYFTCMVTCLLFSSLLGVPAFLSYMQALTNYFQASGDYSSAENFRLIGTNFYWFSVFACIYPWFAILNCVAKLIILRLFFKTFLGNSKKSLHLPQSSPLVQRSFDVFLAIVIMAFCGSIVSWSTSASHAVKAYQFFQLASTNITNISVIEAATSEFSLLNKAQSYANHFESSYLILISVVYVIVGFLSAGRLHNHASMIESSKSTVQNTSNSNKLFAGHKRFVILAALISLRRSNSVVWSTSIFIFISYVINSAYAILYSIADAGTYNSKCTTLCDASCQSSAAMLNHVLRLTPALTTAVLLLSLVLAPLISLINIMRGRTWFILRNRELPVKSCGNMI